MLLVEAELLHSEGAYLTDRDEDANIAVRETPCGVPNYSMHYIHIHTYIIYTYIIYTYITYIIYTDIHYIYIHYIHIHTLYIHT